MARTTFQTVFYLPHFISTVIVAGLVVSFLSPTAGVVNIILRKLEFNSIYFLAEPAYFKPIYVAMDAWIIGLIMTLFPIWYIVAASLSDGMEVQAGNVLLWVKGFTLETYKTVFKTKNIWTSYANTLFYAFVGTSISMMLTILGGYALSKRRLEFRKTIKRRKEK